MIRRDGVAKNAERSRAANLRDSAWSHREVFEEWRLMKVVALLVPLVNLTCARRDLVPLRILPGEIAVKPLKNFRRERRLHRVADLLETRPKITQKNFATVRSLAHRVRRKVEIDAARQGERDDQRRRHQKIRLNVLMDTRFKIPIAG